MRITDFVDYVQTLTPYKVFPLAFPSETEDEAIMIKFEPSTNAVARSNLVGVGLQMIIRAKHPELSEAEATKLLKHFDDRTGFMIGTNNVVISRVERFYPNFLNKDENERYRFSININLLMEK